jgi:tRNA uridine 5-carboxymethylaminomethyl modification enzyme
MTSRAEYRLLLRQDNADERLTEKSYKLGLATKERYDKYIRKKAVIEQEIERLRNTKVKEEIINPVLDKIGSSPVNKSVSLMELMKRPEITYDSLAPADPERPKLMMRIAAQVEVRIKYEGYIERQKRQVEQFAKRESKKIPETINYDDVKSLRIEARQKLKDFRPESIGQASRIGGVSPADVNVLLVYLKQNHM